MVARVKAVAKEEGGQAVFEMAILLFLFLFIIAGLLYLGPRLYVQIAVDTAAYNCATHAGRTLNPYRGYLQGMVAAHETLERFRIRSGTVWFDGQPWGRGSRVTCNVAVDFFPTTRMATWIGGATTVVGRATTFVETFKSRWE